MKCIIFIPFLFAFSLAGQVVKPAITHLKTYSAAEWNKWYFDDYDLKTFETNQWDRWKCEIWGMQIDIETSMEGNWQSWKIGTRGGVCSVVKKKKYNAWIFTSEGKTWHISSASKDLSSWTMIGTDTLTAHIFAPNDWDHWVVEGDLIALNYPEAVAAFLFIPMFSGSIRPVHKLK